MKSLSRHLGGITMAFKKTWYAKYRGDDFIYRSDEFIVQGTKEECAKYLGIKEESVVFLATPSNEKKHINSVNYLTAIKVKEEIESDK